MYALQFSALVLMLNIQLVWLQNSGSADLASLHQQLKTAMQTVPCSAKQQIQTAFSDMLINNLPFSTVETAENQALAQYQPALTAMQGIWNAMKQMKTSIATCFNERVQNQTSRQIVQQFVNVDFTSMTPRDMCNQGVSLHQQLSTDDNNFLHSCQTQQMGNMFGMSKSGSEGSGSAGNFQNLWPGTNGGGNGGFAGMAGGQQQATAGDFCDILMSYVKQKVQGMALTCTDSTPASGSG